MPYFGGINIFGSAVSICTTTLPRAQQVNAFFGLSGLEILDGGSRGKFSDVSGFLYGENALALAASENRFRILNDGVARSLVDMTGVTWNNVILQTYQPRGRILASANGYFLRAYRARFFHLT